MTKENWLANQLRQLDEAQMLLERLRGTLRAAIRVGTSFDEAKQLIGDITALMNSVHHAVDLRIAVRANPDVKEEP